MITRTLNQFFLVTVAMIMSCTTIFSQTLTNGLGGVVTDNLLGHPIEGATVILISTGAKSFTGADGSFRFDAVAVVPQGLKVSHVGYKESIVENIVVNAGKETSVTIMMEAEVSSGPEVVIVSQSRKNSPRNDLSMVSSRAFTVEETQKYAASVNDPLRMVAGSAGVMTPDDGNNNIVIRGNSPAGMLWRMEGIDIPNPNHFSAAGSSGGGISILSSQLLSNSDFITSAFTAGYGNALSGVFDLSLRKGNNNKREYSLQAGVLGLNASAEGPMSAFYKGSYLINYRYSTLGLLSKAGILPDEVATDFQDLSYNIHLPAGKTGNFTIFGFGGRSTDKSEAESDSLKWKTGASRYASKFISNTSFNGITHSIRIGNNSTLKSVIGYSVQSIKDDERFLDDELKLVPRHSENYRINRLTVTSQVNHRLSQRSTLRFGITGSSIRFNYLQKSTERPGDPLVRSIDSKGNAFLFQAYGNWNMKLSKAFTLQGGLHYLRYDLNRKQSFEPRGSLKWKVSDRYSVFAGYGLHSQAQDPGVHFAQVNDGTEIRYPNRNLGLTKASHFVLGQAIRVSGNLRITTEIYYQHLFNVAVADSDSSTFSTLNILQDFVTIPLANRGSGKNYGIELSIEKYLSNNSYFTFSNSFYQSKYTAADGIERNTRFNGNFISSIVAGREYPSANKLRTFGLHVKSVYAGGYRTTPVDLERSTVNGYTVFDEPRAFSIQNSPYFRADIRFSLKWNKPGVTHTVSLDIQNLTNRLNMYNEWFDPDQQKIIQTYQAGLIPVLNYKIDF